MKPRIKKQVFSLVLALSLSFGMTEQTAKHTLAATKGTDKLYSAKTDKIDIYKKNKSPNARNYKADWNEKIFYTLEDINTKSSKDGQIKKYKLVRKEQINKKNGNRIEYEVYKHPKTGKMHKITSIEHRKNDLEITDYYYDDKGKPNFVYQRKDSIYTPVYASFEFTGDRYFFNNDSLIKWRFVKKANDVEEISLKTDKNRKDVKQYSYLDINKKKQKAYDKKEVRMLNAAYNTYNAMLKKSKKSIVKGYIVDSKRNPVANATVEFLHSDKVIGTVKTNANGYYTTGVLPVKDGYTIRVSADGYQTTEGAKAVIDKSGAVIWIDVISLVAVSEASHKVSINVYDGETIKYVKKKAVKTALSGAEVIARKGLNNKTGEQVTTGTTDADGNLVIELVSGVYTLEIRLNGYAVGYKTVVVDEDKNVSAALTKPVKDKEMKVVLSWDGEQDLDSYLFTPYKAKKGNMAYIGGNAKKDKHGNSLYLDGKNGNNVEIINIANIKKGNYKYYVSDYTNSITKNYSAKDMAGLNIRVEVYDKNGLVAVYIIPYNPNGVIWEVFEIKNGKVVPLQNTYKNVKGKKWWIEKKEVGKKKKEIGEKKDEIEKKEEETEKKETQLGENKLYKTGDVVIPLKYDWAGSFSEGLAVVGIEGKWGFIDKSGNEVVPLKYGYADEFSEGLACVSLTNKYKKDKYGFIDKSGNEVVPLKYDWAGSFSEGLAMVKLDGRWSFIDKLGNEILQLSNGDGENFSEGLAMVGSRGIVSFGYYFDQYGFVDRLGNEVVPLEYSSASSFREGLARVSNFGSHGFIDKSGNKVVPLKYDSAGSFSEGLAPVKLDGRWGFIDMSGNEVVPLKYDDVWSFSEGFAPVKLNDRWGFIDRSGNEVLQQLEYDEVLPFSEGFARVRLTDKYNEDKYGFIDKSGKLAVPLKYDWAGSFSEGLAAVSLNDKWGFISR
ncbi:WG repeat-containing protein [Catonella massiliensis]|uniref:WG repeat-containing protein n=1 Tax=Catonella massiliensis TaxID=2799636 RepID=A0ABS1J109_9FIRM|nr:WG repeat-containing protein [Catonella massiliensis]MBK5897817.1 WG repeat-containing protein [Catonella massiliensis]